MKTMFTLSKRATWAVFLSFFSVLFLAASCTKDNPEPEPIPTGDVKVQFVNAFSGSAAQEFYIGGTRFGTQVATYGQASGYATTNTSNSMFAFKDAGSTSATAANASVSLQSPLAIGGSYTFYYFKSSSNVKAVGYLSDDVSAPASGKAKVRFVHLNSFIAQTIPLTISLQGSATPLVKDVIADSSTDYYEVDPTSKFTVTGLSSPITFTNITLAAGKIYTIWLGGNSSNEVTGNLVLQN
jgi:hypothetical protein